MSGFKPVATETSAKTGGGVAVISVSAATEMEMKEQKANTCEILGADGLAAGAQGRTQGRSRRSGGIGSGPNA
jgi:hypothetical protein